MGGPALPGEGGAPHSAGCRIQGSRANTRRAARGIRGGSPPRISPRGSKRLSTREDVARGAHVGRESGVLCPSRSREPKKTSEGPKDSLMRAREKETDRGSRLITVFQTVEMSGLVYGTFSPKKRLKLCLCAQSYVLRGQAARSSSAVNTTRTRAEKERHTPARHVLPFRSHRARGADRRATRARPRSRAGLGPQRRLRGYGRRVRRAPRPRGRRARGRGGARPALRRLPLAARGHVRLLRSRVHQARAPGVPAGVRRVPLAEPGGVPQPGGGVLHRR